MPIDRFASRMALMGLFLFTALMCLVAAQSAAPSPVAAHRDCLTYNPRTVRIDPVAGYWLLIDGDSAMLTFDSRDDAAKALALVQRYSLACFIGRHASNRPGVTASTRKDYIVTYWEGPVGKETTIPAETCTAYDPARLARADKGANGWVVTDGKALTLTLDNEVDAIAAMTLAKRYTAHCSIGHNDFATHSTRVDYWK